MDIKKKDIKKDRSGSHVGSPKKGGGGGKGTWGKGGVDDLITVRPDTKDPNFDSDDEEQSKDDGLVIQTVEVTSPIEAIVKEYFVSGEVSEALQRVKESNLKSTSHDNNSKPNPLSYSDFVRKAMILSMERQPYERELISKLLCASYPLISSQDIADGFQTALDKLDDTLLDIPQAGEMLAKFLARAIVDELIPPSFLTKTKISSPLSSHHNSSNSSSKASNAQSEALALANGLVSDPHRSRKLEHIWGPGDMESVKRLKSEVSKIIAEYLTSGDTKEADQSFRRLSAPSFHFQLVRQALRMALSARSEDERKKILELLAFFHKEGLLVPDHITQGFNAMDTELDDIKLDIPSAPTIFKSITETAKKQGWLS